MSILCSAAGIAQSKQSTAESPLAILDGQAILESQLPAEDQAQLLKMLKQVYSVKLRALHAVVDRKVLEDEAKKRGLTVEALLTDEVYSKIADPTDDQVNSYYSANAATYKQSFEELKDQIRRTLKSLESDKARGIYVQNLVQQAAYDGELVVLMNPPKVEVGIDPERLRGDPKAPITIVEFSDYSCSSCKDVEATMKELLRRYPGKIRLSYRDFPLRKMHPEAELAAEAARCAAEQGRYWEYRDLLLENNNKQDLDGFVADANALKLDQVRFEACLKAERYKNQVDQDVQIGMRNGVVTTPSFFIDGTLIRGAQPIEAFEKAIDAELAAASGKSPQQ